MKSNHVSVGACAALATGVLYAVSRDIGPFGPLALVAPVPILLFALRSDRVFHIAVCAFLARIIGFGGFIYAYHGTFPFGVLAAGALPFAIEFVAVVLLTRWSVRRLPTWAGVFAFPLLATASEFLLLMSGPNGSLGALGYSIIDLLLLTQLASVGGVAALTFIAALVPSVLTVIAYRPEQWRAATAVGVAMLAGFCGFGAWRLSQPYEQTVRVGLASIDELTMRALQGPQHAHEVAQRYSDVLDGFRKHQVDIVVLPERVFVDAEDEISDSSKLLQTTAQTLGASVVAGFDETLHDRRHANTARLFSPDGSIRRYVKRKMIPGLESHLVPGTDPVLFGSAGIAICKDLDFAPMIREYRRRGATLMLVPAWDFKSDGRMHARMSVVRGIENGFALARAAAGGKLTVSDAYGRIVAEKTTSDREPVTLIAEVGLISRGTIYSRIGDAFAWLTVMGAAVLLIIARTRSRRLQQGREVSPMHGVPFTP